jgi:hypothetical protein
MYSLFFVWQIFSFFQPEKHDFDRCKGLLFQRIGPNSLGSEIKKL